MGLFQRLKNQLTNAFGVRADRATTADLDFLKDLTGREDWRVIEPSARRWREFSPFSVQRNECFYVLSMQGLVQAIPLAAELNDVCRTGSPFQTFGHRLAIHDADTLHDFPPKPEDIVIGSVSLKRVRGDLAAVSRSKKDRILSLARREGEIPSSPSPGQG